MTNTNICYLSINLKSIDLASEHHNMKVHSSAAACLWPANTLCIPTP